MRTWLVLAAVVAVAAAAAADALRGGLRDRDVKATAPAAERRIVPPGVPSGFMGTVFYSDPADGCRLHSLRLVGFTDARPPNYTGCRFSLSPDGTRAAPGGSIWSPLGGVVAMVLEVVGDKHVRGRAQDSGRGTRDSGSGIGDQGSGRESVLIITKASIPLIPDP